MPDTTLTIKCPKCPSELASATGGRLKHQADGSHTFVPVTAPKTRTDPKPVGRPRG